MEPCSWAVVKKYWRASVISSESRYDKRVGSNVYMPINTQAHHKIHGVHGSLSREGIKLSFLIYHEALPLADTRGGVSHTKGDWGRRVNSGSQ